MSLWCCIEVEARHNTSNLVAVHRWSQWAVEKQGSVLWSAWYYTGKYALQGECTMCRRLLLRGALKAKEGQEPGSSPRFVSEPSWSLWAYLYPHPAQMMERSKVWSWGPAANFHGWWICVCSSSLVLISNTLLFSSFSAVQFKGLCKSREENCIISFILQNKIQGRKQCPREVACARSPALPRDREACTLLVLLRRPEYC